MESHRGEENYHWENGRLTAKYIGNVNVRQEGLIRRKGFLTCKFKNKLALQRVLHRPVEITLL